MNIEMPDGGGDGGDSGLCQGGGRAGQRLPLHHYKTLIQGEE